MKMILKDQLRVKIRHLGTILIMFVFPTIISFFFYETILIDTFYLIDGYTIEAYVVKSEDSPSNKNYRVELMDKNGKSYIFNGRYGKQKEKYKKLNQGGTPNIIIRSKFLDKWEYFKRGEWSFIGFLVKCFLLGVILLFYTISFKLTKDFIQGKPLS